MAEPKQHPEVVETSADIQQTNKGLAEHSEYPNTHKQTSEDARLATIAEHTTPLWQGLKTYRKAVLWSVLVSSTIIMEGYDVTLIGSFFAYPSFARKYGQFISEEKGYELSAPWQAGIQNIQSVGNIIGALGNGYFTAKYGHRKVMMFNLVFMTGTIFITFFAPNIHTLLIGAFFCSIPWGVFATQGPAYAAEVCPLVLRGYLTAFVNLCWATGQLLSAAILKALVNNKTQWSYRIPFAIQWIYPIPLLIGAYFCPESPWYLVRMGRLDEAEVSLQRLSAKDADINHKEALALMVQTTKLEEDDVKGTSYFDCFKSTNLRRTEIACISFLAQITNGGALAYSPTYFFKQAGIDADTNYGISLGGTGVAFVGTCISWLFINKFGRRSIFLTGFGIMISCLYLIAILACIPESTGIKYVQAAMCVVWLGSYSMTVGPIVYTIVAEIGATRVRTQTVVLGRSTYYLGNIIGQALQPYMMNPTEWNLRGKAGFFWGSTALATATWAWFRLPETKDRTFEELEILFLRRIPARKFAKAEVSEEEE